MNKENVLFKITINLESASEELLFHGHDQPDLVCQRFAVKHNLSNAELTKLIEGVNSCIENLAKSEQELTTESPEKSTTKESPPSSKLKNSEKSPSTVKKNPYYHKKECSKLINPSVKLLETATTKHKRFKLLTTIIAPKREIYSFQPNINKV